MGRLIISDEKGPYKLAPTGKECWLCQCGLSKNKPFCDGSHTRTLSEEIGETYFYTRFTQKRLQLSGVTRAQLEQLRQKGDEIIFKSKDIEIHRVTPRSKLYQKVCEIRGEYSQDFAVDKFDLWSDIYLLKKGERYSATMRVTQARDGFLDVEKYYPDFLQIPSLRSIIGSANKLFKSRNSDCTRDDIFQFIVEVWKDQYEEGMRIDLINATLPMIRYYRLLGYVPIGDVFMHPQKKEDSRPLIYIANIKNDCLLTRSLKVMLELNTSSLEEYEFIKSQLPNAFSKSED